MVTSETDFGATGDRIPRGFSPFNGRIYCHDVTPFFWYLSKVLFTIFAPFSFGEAKNK
jgi:hypothetical protein